MEGDAGHGDYGPEPRKISIHTLRVEGDTELPKIITGIIISIHTLRVEGDYINQLGKQANKVISIHTLRVEGDWAALTNATDIYISIHTLRVEGDRATESGSSVRENFYPHPPCGG